VAEIGIDITSGASKSVEVFRSEKFEFAITVCDNARAACPFTPGTSQQLHWPFVDPAEAQGTKGEQMQVFRPVCDEITTKIRSFLAS
jgi:arsenate reductase (thioredoxin)